MQLLVQHDTAGFQQVPNLPEERLEVAKMNDDLVSVDGIEPLLALKVTPMTKMDVCVGGEAGQPGVRVFLLRF